MKIKGFIAIEGIFSLIISTISILIMTQTIISTRQTMSKMVDQVNAHKTMLEGLNDGSSELNTVIDNQRYQYQKHKNIPTVLNIETGKKYYAP